MYYRWGYYHLLRLTDTFHYNTLFSFDYNFVRLYHLGQNFPCWVLFLDAFFWKTSAKILQPFLRMKLRKR